MSSRCPCNLIHCSVDVIAAMLHQRGTSVTKYYSQPTRTQVMDAAEMLFVDRIDVAAEALRSPAEVGRMLAEAEGKVGALTELIGGTCVVANLCPAKFACIGCAGNAPDPDKRYQIVRKMAWAREHALWSTREKLFPEERRLNQLVQDCELMLEEMSLIEQAERDSLQTVQIETRPLPVSNTSDPSSTKLHRWIRLWTIGATSATALISMNGRDLRIDEWCVTALSAQLCNVVTHSSRSRTRGLMDSARCAGIHVASNPSAAIARTTPARTRGSRGVA